jgi:hypothetical protein
LRLDYRNRNFRPAPEGPIAARDQAVAVHLRRRDEEGVVKPMARETGGEARQDGASARSDRGVDWVDAVSEARDDLVEPVSLRVGALRLEPRQLVDAQGDLG